MKHHPPQRPSLLIFRTPWKGIPAPFEYAEFTGNLHFWLRLMVVELEAKRWKLRQHEKFRPTNFTPLNHHHHLQSERLGRLFLHLSNTLNRMAASVCLPDWWLWSYRRNAENSASIKNSAHQTSPPLNTITTYNQNALEGCFCTFQPCWIEW